MARSWTKEDSSWTGNAVSVNLKHVAPDRVSHWAFRREGLFCFKDKQGEFKASIEKVEINGRLWLKDEDRKERSYLFKEVEYVL